MLKTVLGALALFAIGFLNPAPAPADAAEIKLVSSVGVKSAMESSLPGFERASGHKVTPLYGTAAGLKTRIDGGEAFDVVVLDTPPAQHAIDFLNAPQKLALIFSEGVARWFRDG